MAYLKENNNQLVFSTFVFLYFLRSYKWADKITVKSFLVYIFILYIKTWSEIQFSDISHAYTIP